MPDSTATSSTRRTSANSPHAGFVSTKTAARYFDYCPDYIARLAREGKVVAHSVDRQWLVSLESLKLFSLTQEQERAARTAALRQQRREEYLQRQCAEVVALKRSGREPALAPTARRQAVLLTFVALLCSALLVQVGWVVAAEQVSLAQLWRGSEQVLERMAAALPAAQPEREAVEGLLDTPLPAHYVTITETGLQVSADVPLSEVFSDPVTVHSLTDQRAVVTPVFSDAAPPRYEVAVTPVGAQ